MEKYKWPSVSFVIATYNSERTIKNCLSAISKQDYPSPIEIVIGDGGSTDRTLNVIEKYSAKVVSVPEEKQNAEYNKGTAVNAAKNEIIVFIDHDNILPHKKWLRKMVRPLLEDEQIFGAGVLRFHYKKSMTLLDRYFALFGAADPIAFFLNKSAHQSWLYDQFNLRGTLLEGKPDYYIVELDPERMPALGGNGALLRRKLLKEAKSDPEHFFHIDIHVDLAKKGYTKYAFVKESIIHLTNNSLLPFLKRRKYYIEKYHFKDFSKRRYSVYESKKDRLALMRYIIYAMTIFGPLFHSLRGFFKIRDLAWFIHPVISLAMLIVYGSATIQRRLKHVTLAR